jgi:Uma2 family endonuclease
VEVLFPGTAGRDRTLKRARYLRFGLREYWMADPQSRTIEVLQAGPSDFEIARVFPESTVATSPLLEGIACIDGSMASAG